MRIAWLFVCAGCYSGSRAAPDVNAAWRGHARVEVEARLGAPTMLPDGSALWTRRGHDVTLPSGGASIEVTPTKFVLDAAIRPGEIRSYDYAIARASFDSADRILAFDSGAIAAGVPSGANLRTGIVFGAHGGAGAIDDGTSPWPSFGVYIGGMIGPRLALVGAYQFATGRDDISAVVYGMSWGLGAQYWATSRLSVRGGPAMVLDSQPVRLAPGAQGALSYAVLRAGSFVLDVRVDATVSTANAFGMLGVGVNVN